MHLVETDPPPPDTKVLAYFGSSRSHVILRFTDRRGWIDGQGYSYSPPTYWAELPIPDEHQPIPCEKCGQNIKTMVVAKYHRNGQGGWCRGSGARIDKEDL
jgi:hypothetical protein